ncbi:unnamed protein product [Aphanomyces euteiches]
MALPSSSPLLAFGSPSCATQTACLIDSVTGLTSPFVSSNASDGSFVGSFARLGNLSTYPGSQLYISSSQPFQVADFIPPSTLVSLELHGAVAFPSSSHPFPSTLKRFIFASSSVTALQNVSWPSLQQLVLDGTPLTTATNWSLSTNLTTFSCPSCAFTSFLPLLPKTYSALNGATSFSVKSISSPDKSVCQAASGVVLELRRVYSVCVLGSESTSHAWTIILAAICVVVFALAATYVFKWRKFRWHDDEEDGESGGAAPYQELPDDLAPFRISPTALELNEKLNAGSCGEVWLATLGLESVAVKVLRKERRKSERTVAAFLAEINLMSQLRSPYIVGFVGVVWTKDPAKVKCVMEYMDRGDLRSHLKKNANLSWPQFKIHVALNLAHALVYLHARDIIHRDVKARNVMLHSVFGAKLSDFGVATQEQDATMDAVGTYRWMAPEVLRQSVHSTAADIFSFGVVLSELDTHRVPYEEHGLKRMGDDADMIERVFKGKLKPSFTETCPPWITALATQCMLTQPELRPTADQIVQIIESTIRSL